MDVLTPEQRHKNMSSIRSTGTIPEKRIRSLLHRLGYRFRLHARCLPGSPDVVLPKYKTVVFVHGCFWHRHNGCTDASVPKTNTEKWMGKFSKNVERDHRVINELEALGWSVMVIWECELKKINELTERIQSTLKQI